MKGVWWVSHSVAIGVRLVVVSTVLLVTLSVVQAQPTDSCFTYQGQLKDGGVPVNDTCDLRFKLRLDPNGTDETDVVGTLYYDGSDPNYPPVQIQGGLFAVSLDFGADALAPGPVWLDVGVRCPSGSADPYVGLLPRQAVTSAPYSVHTRGITVDSAGYVGINSPSPASRLDVRGVIQANAVQGPNLIIHDLNAGADRPGIEFSNNDVQYLGGDDLSDEQFGFYSTFSNQRTYDAVLSVHGRANGSWGKALTLTHDGTDGTIRTDAGQLFLLPAGGRVGINTSAPKQSLHNAGDYYGKGHVWLHAFEGDGLDGTAYIQARDDSGSSSIAMRLRTQFMGSLKDAVWIAPTGGVGIGVSAPAEGLWVRGFGAPAYGGQLVVDSSDTTGNVDTGPSVHFANMLSLGGTSLGWVGCFKEDSDPLHTAHYLSLATKAQNQPPEEKLRITGTGRVGIGTSVPDADLAVGDNAVGTATSRVANYTKQLLLGGAFNAGSNTGNAVKLLINGYDNDPATDVYPIYAEDENNGIDFYVRNHEGVRTAYFADMVGIGTSPFFFRTAYRLNVESRGIGSSDDWAGHFKDSNGSGEVWLAGDDGFGHDYGVEARGNIAGAFFHDADGYGEVRLAYSTGHNKQYGVYARGRGTNGEGAGGYFEDDLGDNAYLATGGWGVWGYGIAGGGSMEDTSSGTYVYLGFGGSSISGNGAKNFVQNHPHDASRVIQYAAPEGDEVATYTRGSARLVHGEARVVLDETFQWVTNPDIGLTAHLTPRGDCRGLYVVSVNPKELVVRELGGGRSNAAFDYLVYGLRIGFEEVAIVREKQREAPIPSMAGQRKLYEQHPELRRFNALERFKNMAAAAFGTRTFDMQASRALHDAVVEFDPAVHRIAPDPSAGGAPVGTTSAAALEQDAGSPTPVTTEAAPVWSSVQAPVRESGESQEIADLKARIERLESLLASRSAGPDGAGR